MSAVLDANPPRGGAGLEWLPVIAGLLVLYVPTYYDLAVTLWQLEDHAHAPIILGVTWLLLWQKRERLLTGPARPAPWAGWGMLIFGLLIYVLGRSQNIILFELGSQIPVIAGALALMRGMAAVRMAWFPLLFLAFMVPLPSFVVDTFTPALRQWISMLAETALYHAGYPIARGGTVIVVGQYHLLVADACSGLNSMFSLAAVGLLYLYLARHKEWWRNAILIASIVPIAFLANMVRVMSLIVITYHFGDEVGQGFFHGFSGILLFGAALLLLLGVDSLLRPTVKLFSRAGAA
jgi:exosortase B